MSAENTVNLSRNMSSSFVLLEGKIHSSSQEGSNIVSSVRPVTELESCQDIEFDSTGYTVSFDDFVGVCVYQYDAENLKDPEQKASAYAISVAQKSVDSEVDLFTPISDTTLVGEPLTIDLKNDPNFVAQVPEGYTMDQDITLIGEGEAAADTANQTITYKPTEQGGFAKIIYSYSNGSEVKLGNIAISVSSSPNTAPNAPDIDYSDDTDAEEVYVNEEVIIDLAKYVSDEDGDALQLVYTDSWNAAVSPLNPEDMNNLKLKFETTNVGEHIVSYAVSDHYGGYATGMIRIEVYDSEVEPSWGNLQLDMNTYSAPLVKSEADAQGITYTSTHVDTEANGANVATFNLQQAKELCASSGRLPTADELNALSEIGGIGPATYDGWPVEVDYWALDSGSASTVDLKSGQTSETPNAGGQYVTCVGEGGYRIDNSKSTLAAIGDGEDQAVVAVQATFNGEPVEGITVEAAVTGSANLVNTSLKTDVNGYASFHVVDAIAEKVNFTTNIENSDFTPTVQLQFTGNPNTAELQLSTVTDNQPLTGVNVFESRLEDANGSPVPGQVIVYQENEDLTYTPSTPETNDQGVQRVSVQLQNQSGSTYEYTVQATYDRPDGSRSEASLPMRFYTPPPPPSHPKPKPIRIESHKATLYQVCSYVNNPYCNDVVPVRDDGCEAPRPNDAIQNWLIQEGWDKRRLGDEAKWMTDMAANVVLEDYVAFGITAHDGYGWWGVCGAMTPDGTITDCSNGVPNVGVPDLGPNSWPRMHGYEICVRYD
ncbi:adhesion domain-containing protein [Vibrio jasicida]|uniref:adhesion domain-containing protein n=1 Tax=Vibrio jasicida TaxID=766224 RepID=UPI00391B95CF